MIDSVLGTTDRESDLSFQYCDVRRKTLMLCAPLEADDFAVQSMPDASPIKWHLAHITWFFEQFVLLPWLPGFQVFDSRYSELFNSYYQSLGAPYPRESRGLLSRPTLPEVLRYRHYVDERIQHLLSKQSDARLHALISLGIQHEKQHQELMLTDIKDAFAKNPLRPVYRKQPHEFTAPGTTMELQFIEFDGGIHWVGAAEGFSFDNERPRHRVIAEPFALANRLVTNEEYMAFVRTGGYRRADYWLADGWSRVQEEEWTRPLYWHESLESEFTLHGVDELRPNAPVCHLSYFEADAFARWAGMRLPTEFEWEIAARMHRVKGNFADLDALHPLPAHASPDSNGTPPYQLFGDAWEWTSSAYSAYPGFARDDGAIGEYNGKFMSNAMVLRGGSCATPSDHLRSTYRNFFAPRCRWQFAGIRLAR